MRARRSAFTMLEILVASTLLVVLLIPVVTLSQRGATDAGSTREDLLARKLVIDMCERFKRSKPEELRRYSENPGLMDQDPLLVTPDGLAAGTGTSKLQRRLGFEENYDGIPGVHKIRLEVAWETRFGKKRSVSLARLVHAH